MFNHLSGASTVSVLLNHASLGINVNPPIATLARESCRRDLYREFGQWHFELSGGSPQQGSSASFQQVRNAKD
jgi:hypothetical protein